MGALKPWHLFLATLCCMLPLTAALAGAVWAARRKRRGGGGGDA